MRFRDWILLIAITITPIAAHAQQDAIANSDFDGNGRVEFSDFIEFAAAFGLYAGQIAFDSKFDLDGSGLVDFGDFLLFAQSYGKSTTVTSDTFLYVADFFGNRVNAVNIANNLVIPTRSFSTNLPRGLAIGSQSSLVYVVTLDSLNAFTEDGTHSFGVALTPFENPTTGTPTAPYGFKVTVNAAETLAFVTEDVPQAVEVIDLTNRISLGQVVVGPSPGNSIMSADESELYVGLNGTKIAIVEVATRTLVDSIIVAQTVTNRIAISDDRSTLYVATSHPDEAHTSGSLVQIQALDLVSRTAIDSVQISDPADLSGQVADLKTSPPGGSLLVSYSRTAPGTIDNLPVFLFRGDVFVVSLPNVTVTNTINIGELAYGFGMSPDGTTAYVSGSEDLLNQAFQIFVVDLTTGQRLSQLPLSIMSASEFVFETTKAAIARMAAMIDLAFGP